MSSVREPVRVSLSKRAREDDGRCWIWLSQFRVSVRFIFFILYYSLLSMLEYLSVVACLFVALKIPLYLVL